MPIFTLICDACRQQSEHIMHYDDHTSEMKCPCCSAPIVRRADGSNRAWMTDGPSMCFQGDTVAGCVNMSNYYDDGLDSFVTGRGHRKELMKAKGLTEYAPDPITQEMTTEIRHIRKNTDFANDPTAVKAAREVGKAADKKRKQRAVRAAIDRGMAGLK